MPLEVTCSHCRETLWVPDEYAGKTGKCHACGTTIQVPAAPQTASTRSMGMVKAWAVLLDPPSLARLDPEEHHKVLAKPMNAKPREAPDLLLRSQGILGRGFSASDAEAVRSVVGSLGLTCFLVPSQDVIAPPPANYVRRLQWDGEALTSPAEGSRAEVRLPWSGVLAINRGRAPSKRVVEEEVRASSGMLPVARLTTGRGAAPEPAPRQIGGQLVADIVSEDPWLRLRISSETIDCSALEGAQPGAAYANMRLLLSRMMANCGRVVLNALGPELQAPADGEEVDPLGGRLFEARTEWLFNLARFLLAQEGRAR